jgi:uncharacterized membrane protein (UPF0182 family)
MRLRGLPGLLLLGAALLFVIPSSVTYYTDWLWFRELQYEGIFLRTLNAQFVVFAATFVAVFLFLSLNLRAARSTVRRAQVVVGTGPDGRAIAVDTAPLLGLSTPVAAVVALLLGVAGAGRWEMWLSFFNSTSFGQTDPLFGRDVSFYVFRLPAWQAVQQQALVTTILTTIGCGVYYVLSGSFVIEPRFGGGFFPRIRLVTRARRHMGMLAAAIFALIAWGTWFSIPGTLLTPANVIHGASYVDVHARLPIIRLTVAVLTAGAGLSLFYGFSRASWPLPVAALLYMVVTFGGGLYSASIQRLIVVPDELNREQPYILNNIAATRRAYAIDRVEEREVSGDAELTAGDIGENRATIENIRLWDHQPLLQTFAQIQEIRTYYDFKNVDNDRYLIDGNYRQVMLSARELNTESACRTDRGSTNASRSPTATA